MAQGNWNILFQEGPFHEFQRQMAIAGHFALRGEITQAEFYYKRAETSLDIAYASLRSRFEWPRSPVNLRAENLSWGENRETYRDYLLCRLQLYIESGLAGHDAGKISLDKLSETVSRTESLMGQSLQQKDADLDKFVALLRGSIGLRSAAGLSGGLRALKFQQLSAKFPPSVGNYWRRRTLFFQIQEHLYYGNLGIALALTDLLYAQHGDQTDRLAIARFWIQASNFAAATNLLTQEFYRNEIRSGENYQELLRISETLQNLLVWQKQYLRAAEIAQESHNLLDEFTKGNLVPREELVAVRRSAANQKLRSEMLRYLAEGACPATLQPFEGSEAESEWRIREHLFYEKCGLPVNGSEWQKLLNDKSLGADAREIIRFVRGKPGTQKTAAGSSALLQFLRLYRKPARPEGKGRRKERAIALLETAGKLYDDFVFLDWGLTLPTDTTARALAELKNSLRPDEAAAVFSALNRQFARRHLRGSSLLALAATDASELSGELHYWILGGDYSLRKSAATEADGDLLYADSNQTIAYQSPALRVMDKWEALGAEEKSRLFRAKTPVYLFGRASVLAIPARQDDLMLHIAPLFPVCRECSPAPRTPARLLMHEEAGNGWKSTQADLADIFSGQLNLKTKPECNFTAEAFQDTLIAQAMIEQAEYPCNLTLENLIVEEDEAEPAGVQNLLWAIAGRQTGAALLLPKTMNQAARTAFLFDFLQRRNLREVSARQAFDEAQRRAKKSFPPGSGIEAVRIYAAE